MIFNTLSIYKQWGETLDQFARLLHLLVYFSSVTMAAISCFSTIVTPSSSSSTTSSTSLYCPTKQLLKTSITFKPHNVTLLLSPLHLHLHLHLCRCAPTAIVVDDVETEVPAELEQSIQGESEVVENDVKASSEVDGGRLYVGNLPFSVTSTQLSEIFSRAGQIKSVEIIPDKMSGRSRGFGFVTMESVDEAKEVIRMFNGSEVGGRTIKVNFPEVPIGGEQRLMESRFRNESFVDTPHKVYAGNLAWSITTQSLRDAFADQTGFVSAKVIYERRGRSRGFGFVTFESADAAQSAISAMDGKELEGRAIRLNMADNRSRANTVIATEQAEVVSAVNSETE